MRLIASLLAIVLSALPTVAISQPAPAAECTEILEELRWLLDDDAPTHLLASDHKGAVLLGVPCNPEVLKDWFLSAGWKFLGQSSRKPEQFGPFGAPGEEYYQDKALAFCIPRQFPFRWLTQGCSMGVEIYLFEGRITHIGAAAYI